MDEQIEWLAAYVEKCMRESLGDEGDCLSCYGSGVVFRAGRRRSRFGSSLATR